MRKEKREKRNITNERGTGSAVLMPIIVTCSLLFVLFVSCRSVPVRPDPYNGPVSALPLDAGAQVYAIVDVGGSRPVLDTLTIQGIKDTQKKRFLDSTDSLALALSPSGGERLFQLAAWGKFSSAQGFFIFGFSKDWKKARNRPQQAYWYSKTGNMSVAFEPGQVYASQSKTVLPGNIPASPFAASGGTEFPGDFPDFARGAVLSCWIENPGMFISRFIGEMGIPLNFPAEDLFIGLFPAEDLNSGKTNPPQLFNASVLIKTSSVTQAKSLARIIAIVRAAKDNLSGDGAFPPILDFLLSADPVQDDRFVRITSGPVSPSGIALLINSISVYSKSNN